MVELNGGVKEEDEGSAKFLELLAMGNAVVVIGGVIEEDEGNTVEYCWLIVVVLAKGNVVEVIGGVNDEDERNAVEYCCWIIVELPAATGNEVDLEAGVDCEKVDR